MLAKTNNGLVSLSTLSLSPSPISLSLFLSLEIFYSLIFLRIFKDFEYKKQLAVCLAKNYPQLSKNFLNDTHHHDVCVSEGREEGGREYTEWVC